MHLVRCGSGYPILFIHGMPTNHHLWSAIVGRLFGHYTCFAVDLPGLGKSPRESYGPQYLQSLADGIEALRIRHKVDKWHVVGHDAGSAVAVHYAHRYPQHVDCLALMSPAVFPELRPYHLLEALRKPVVGEMLAPLISLIFWKIAMRRAVDDGQGNAAAIVRNFQEPFSGLLGAWRFMRTMRWGKPSELLADLPSFLPNLRVPTLILQGVRDPAIPGAFAERAAALIPNASRVCLDAGHFLPLNQPGCVAANLLEFFSRQASREEEAIHSLSGASVSDRSRWSN